MSTNSYCTWSRQPDSVQTQNDAKLRKVLRFSSNKYSLSVCFSFCRVIASLGLFFFLCPRLSRNNQFSLIGGKTCYFIYTFNQSLVFRCTEQDHSHNNYIHLATKSFILCTAAIFCFPYVIYKYFLFVTITNGPCLCIPVAIQKIKQNMHPNIHQKGRRRPTFTLHLKWFLSKRWVFFF